MPFEELQGFLDSSSYGTREDLCSVVGVNNNGSEPTSVLDSNRSTSPFLSSSTTTTLSSSHGGPSGGGAAEGKCDQMTFEDLDGVLSGSPGQEESILRLIMGGDVVDPGSEFMGFDPGSGSDPVIDNPNPLFGYSFPLDLPPPEEEDVKFRIYPNPCLSSGGSSPPAKRFNSGQPVSHQLGHPFSDPGHPFSDPGHPFLAPPKLAGTTEEDYHVESSAVITEQLFNAAAELTGTGNGSPPVLAQGILARLNHNLNNSNINPKPPFQRAALYVTESLQSLLQHSPPQPSLPLFLKIAAHRAFSETSPFLHFVNFTSNQTILESSQGFDRIRIVDFDVGYGSQWSSLIQELGNRSSSSAPLSLKVTSFSSPSTVSDEFELRFTEENLRAFAGEAGVAFEMELMNMETLLNPPLSLLRSSDKEAIAVNLPISSVISGYLPFILRFLKQISPNVVVCSDTIPDAPFPNVVIDALQYYASLLESLESPSSSQEAVTSIERFCVQPWIERVLSNRYRWMEKTPPWGSLFEQCGFTPVAMSQTAETQAEYLLQRNPMRGFHLEKRQSSSSSTSTTSLVLCWQKTQLVAVSAWTC
ncbi:Scarecrow-like protein 22 [Raphanus sativus]|uniref:Scarecrow-like protein 22 n=1 Tax=Raphanus sativus TaxID=3726 RepID=A0A6J0M5E1_RAPSA|nr:scarecrow-like protein 22 [Raphanus sativus]KAJ4905309.1 Scarecrow-like protein 22 [Raphanus sativus]